MTGLKINSSIVDSNIVDRIDGPKIDVCIPSLESDTIRIEVGEFFSDIDKE
jgi:hypothetical protein